MKDLFGLRVTATVVLGIVALVAIALFFIAEVQRGDKDPTAADGFRQLLVSVIIPIAIYVFASVRMAQRKRSVPKGNVLAPLALILLIVTSVGMLVWMALFCFVLTENVTVTLADGTHQLQSIPFPLGKGVGLLSKYIALILTFILSLDVYTATT